MALIFGAETQYAPEVFDAVLYGLGGMTPVTFLQTAGVQLDVKGEPLTAAAHESSVPKLYIIGDLLGHGHGGGSIISGFNSASQAVRHVFCGSGVFGLAALGRFCSN